MATTTLKSAPCALCGRPLYELLSDFCHGCQKVTDAHHAQQAMRLAAWPVNLPRRAPRVYRSK